MSEKIIYGLINLREERELARASHGYIMRDISDLKNQYIRLGFHLAECQRMKYYEDFGFDNFYEYCDKNFKLDKSAVSRVINVWHDFCICNDSGTHTMFINPRYEDYSYSQLVEMLPMDQVTRSKCKPNMTVKQLRDLKAVKKQIIKEDPGTVIDVPVEEVATSQPEDVKPKILKCNSDPENKSILPVLKNDTQRKEWLSNYKAWGLWYYDENIDVNYYKFDFPDGSRLVVAEYPKRPGYYLKEYEDQAYYHLLEKNYQGYKKTYDKQYVHAPDSETYLVDFLKRLQKK